MKLFSKIRSRIKTIVPVKEPEPAAQWKQMNCPLPVPHQLKQRIISGYARKTGYKVFIETGTYLGLMIDAQKNNFERLFSIELDDKLFAYAVEKFKHSDKIKIWHGDSGTVLSGIMKTINEPAIFWLDGHYSGDITALGDKECPILEEMEAIFNASRQNHLLLIDDARLFIGKNDYPTIPDLSDFIKARNAEASITVDMDIIICKLKWQS